MRWLAINFLLVLIVAITLLGCAAIMHGSHQEVSFNTSPVGARVEAFDQFGMSQGVCETPCRLDLKRKREYKVFIEKAGFSSVEIVIDKKTDGWIWGNILFGGLIGLVVDLTSGSAYRLSPKEVNATLSPVTIGELNQSGQSPSIVVIDYASLSTDEKARLSKFEPVPLSEL